jgi:hypothetical protein
MDPNNLAVSLNLPNLDISGKVIIKIVDFGDKQNEYPLLPHINDFLQWTIMPESHQAYSNFWITVTILNWMTNIFVWLYL